MQRSRQVWLALSVAALLALVSVLVPRLHVHALPSEDDLVLAAYAMPDGTLPDLCGVVAAAEDGGTAVPPHCFACRLVAAPGLLAASFGFDRPLPQPVEVDRPETDEPHCEALAWRPDRARAPPAFRSQA